MGRGEAKDLLVDRDLPILPHPGEVVGDAHLVEPRRDERQRQERLDLRRERERPPRSVVVVEGVDAEVVPRAEQRLRPPVPDGEREIAEQPLRAPLTPPLVRR